MVLTLSGFSQNFDELWSQGNKAYAEGRYQDAAIAYDSIIRSGNQSAMLYYNLGNSYFKLGKIGLALVNYYRAEGLAPDNQDIKYNINIASTYVQDKIEHVPEFFLNKWIRSIQTMLNSNLWAAISLISLTVALLGTLIYLFSQRIGLRKTGFFAGIICLILFAISLSFAAKIRSEIVKPTRAVIINSAVAIKASPDNGSKDVFVLHEGTLVNIVRNVGKWSEIVIADGNKGWLNSATIQLID